MAPKTIDLTLNEFSLYRLDELKFLFTPEGLQGCADLDLEIREDLKKCAKDGGEDNGQELVARLRSIYKYIELQRARTRNMPKKQMPLIRNCDDRPAIYCLGLNALACSAQINLGLIHRACITFIALWNRGYHFASAPKKELSGKLQHAMDAIQDLANLVMVAPNSKTLEILEKEISWSWDVDGRDDHTNDTEIGWEQFHFMPYRDTNNDLLDRVLGEFGRRVIADPATRLGRCLDSRDCYYLRRMLEKICRSATRVESDYRACPRARRRDPEYRQYLGAHLLKEYVKENGIGDSAANEALGNLLYGIGYFRTYINAAESFKRVLKKPMPICPEVI